MSKTHWLAGPAIALGLPTASSANSSTRLVAYVPVQCSVAVIDSASSGTSLRLHVRRRCNSSHSIVIEGLAEANGAEPQLRYNSDLASVVNGRSIVPQKEGYYDQIDTIEIEQREPMPEGSLTRLSVNILAG